MLRLLRGEKKKARGLTKLLRNNLRKGKKEEAESMEKGRSAEGKRGRAFTNLKRTERFPQKKGKYRFQKNQNSEKPLPRRKGEKASSKKRPIGRERQQTSLRTP